MSGSAVTLSVGIGIGHVLESMGDLLELGRAAERLAKKRRNSLGIIVDKRSGGTIEWTDGWDASESPAARLASDINILSNRLSSKKVYEVRRDQRTFPSPRDIEVLDNGRRAAFCAALKADVGRTIKRTDAGGSRLGPQDVGLDTSSTDYGNVYASIESWVSRMLVARTIVEAEPQSKGGQ
jgi:CRISPR-associated protein Cmr2